MKYLALIKHAENVRTQEVPKAFGEAMGQFVGAAMQSGLVVETGGLKSTAEAFRIRTSGGKLHVTDGPFTEAKEIIGGFAILNVSSVEEIRRATEEFMELHRANWPEFEGECEVRQIEEM